VLKEQAGRAPAELCEIGAVDPERVAQGRALLLSDDDYTDLSETFRALGDSNRVRMLHALSEQELCVCDLALLVGLSESAVSQHLRLLRNLRIVRTRRDGKNVYYTLADDHVRVLLGVSLRHLGHTQTPQLAEEEAALGG
jgi:DNA-binding transcriptional ArsR family regulator